MAEETAKAAAPVPAPEPAQKAGKEKEGKKEKKAKREAPAPVPPGQVAFRVRNLDLHYGENHVLRSIDMDIPRHKVTALIGPSGCGKSTLLRCFNRMNDLIPSCRIRGSIALEGGDIHAQGLDVAALRRRVGMVFQRPNPFPKSIFENVAFGLRLMGLNDKAELAVRVEQALRGAALWDETHNRLGDSALELSGGQQQRLVIARAIAVEPEVLLLDEPASALDPMATLRIEQLVAELKSDYTVVIVTHNMQQATRISDYTGMMYLGQMVEFGETEQIFTNPREKRTEDYILGRFG